MTPDSKNSSSIWISDESNQKSWFELSKYQTLLWTDSLEFVDPLDPAEHVEGDATGYDLHGNHRGQRGHPRDLVVLEPLAQSGVAPVL